MALLRPKQSTQPETTPAPTPDTPVATQPEPIRYTRFGGPHLIPSDIELIEFMTATDMEKYRLGDPITSSDGKLYRLVSADAVHGTAPLLRRVILMYVQDLITDEEQ